MKTLILLLLVSLQVQAQTATDDTGAPKRIGTLNRWFLSFGPGYTDNLDTQGANFNWNVAYNFESEDSAIRIFGEGTSSRSTMFGIGGGYYFSQTDITPVVQGWLGYGWTRLPNNTPILDIGETNSGFVLGGGAGVQFMHLSRVNLELILHYSRYLVSNRLGPPATYGLRVGVLF
jgi:hypothetical protein